MKNRIVYDWEAQSFANDNGGAQIGPITYQKESSREALFFRLLGSFHGIRQPDQQVPGSFSHDIDTAIGQDYNIITGKCNHLHFSEVRSVRLWNRSDETCI